MINNQRARYKITSNFKFFYITTSARGEKAGRGRWNFLTNLKDMQSRCNQNKRKTDAPDITHLRCSLVLLLTFSLQLIASRCLPIISACLHFIVMHHTFLETMAKKFWEISRICWVDLVVLKRINIFWKLWNGSINLFGIINEEYWFLIS